LLGLYGGADLDIPLDTIARRRAACKAAEKPCEIIVHPGAPHAFHADDRPSYRPEAAEDGWARRLAWFRTYGVA
jgi:carboxymethylenebutenolidase